MQVKRLALAGLALPLIAGQATAHHSFAMFDPDRLITQQGVVKEFEWTNPHVWLHIMTPDATGKPVEWSFEMQAVAAATTGGWRATVKPGEGVLEVFPPKNDHPPEKGR